MSLIISLVVLFIMKIRFLPGKSIANIKFPTDIPKKKKILLCRKPTDMSIILELE